MDPGARLLELVNERVAAGEDRHAAKSAVFAAEPDLVAAWHAGSGLQRETELAVYPGDALLQLSTALERTGVPRERAVRMALDRHPHLARAHHEGRTIPRPPRPRLGGSLRRVRADDMIDGRPYLHLCSDEASGGGIFAIGH